MIEQHEIRAGSSVELAGERGEALAGPPAQVDGVGDGPIIGRRAP
ncbi:MAG TPA: hypothetical protein VKH41_03705 [Myxococcota bacterium]|nr:hypothetical protein [Myxococcota bacterium]